VVTGVVMFASAALLAMAATVPADEITVDWCTIDGGGDMRCTGGSLELSGTIGQPDAGLFVMTGGALELAGGFWGGGTPQPDLPGDFDSDGDVDLDDYTVFADCLAGPDALPSPSLPGVTPQNCLDAFDFDAPDGDVDVEDFSAFQATFTGALP
jgi:hypothetical protein